MLKPGDRVDRYIVEGELGEGALATVYRVRHATLHTTHALKVVKIAHKEARDRLITEGQVQAQLHHDNIVNVTDVLTVQGSPATLMEFVRGIDLEQLLQNHYVALDDALAIFRGVVCGIGHAHAKGLVHRDLKPANVLLAIEEDRLVPKVADFGLVKAVAGEAKQGGTRSGATMGTPGYMSPEQIRDASTVDRRADMWSLGCLLYRMVCHMPAYPQADIIELFKAVGQGSFADPRSHVPDLPDAVVNALEALLVADSHARLQSCADLLAILDDGATAPPPVAALRPIQTPETSRPRHIAASSSTGIAALSMVGDAETALLAEAALPAGGATLAPPPPTLGTERRTIAAGFVLFLVLGTVGAALIGAAAVGLGASYFDRPTAEGTPMLPTPADASPKREPKLVQTPRPKPETPIPAPAVAPEAPQPAVPYAPTPGPAPAPVPTPPTPAPEAPAPVAAPAPEPVAAPEPTGPTGRILCEGCDGDLLVFGTFGKPIPNGSLPAGDYDVKLMRGDESVAAGKISLQRADEVVSIRCNLGNCVR